PGRPRRGRALGPRPGARPPRARLRTAVGGVRPLARAVGAGRMRCAVITDVHANSYALAAVAADIRGRGVDVVLNAGDTFGYYPWAQEAFELLHALPAHSVLGNHDAFVRGAARPEKPPSYWDAIEQNRQALAPAAWEWLRSLPCELRLDLD